MSDTNTSDRERSEVQIRQVEDELLGVTKVTHNGRPPGRRSPQINVPVQVVAALGAEIGDRIVWVEDGGQVGFFRVTPKEWERYVGTGSSQTGGTNETE